MPLNLRTLTMLLLLMMIIIMRIRISWSSLSWEVNRLSYGQEILCNLWDKQVCHLIHKSPLLVPILNRTNDVHAPSHFLKAHFNIIFQSKIRSTNLSLSLGIPYQNYIKYLINKHYSSGFTVALCLHLSDLALGRWRRKCFGKASYLRVIRRLLKISCKIKTNGKGVV